MFAQMEGGAAGAFLKQWEPAKAAWARRQKVIRLIGYDASPADTRRHAHASAIEHDLFECRYPLREWKWDRAACIARIEAAGLPVPPKSSCFICGAMKPDEVRALPAWCLRLIVLVEARAARVCEPSKASGAGRPRPGPAE
jgi:hypothetical protein